MRFSHLNGFIVLTLALFAHGSAARAQTSTAVQQGFAPLVVPTVAARPRPSIPSFCRQPWIGAPPGMTVVVDLQETAVDVDPATDNPYFREVLYRWMVGEYVREHHFAAQPSTDWLLATVRRRYSPAQIIGRLCAGSSAGSVCRPRIAWRATFRRDGWCGLIERGADIRPSTDILIVGTMVGRVCLAGPSSPLPCPAPSRAGRVRVMRGDLAQLIAQPPSAPDETMTGDAVGDAFGYGGTGVPTTVWGGGGTGEGTIGMGNIGTMGHSGGAGSSQGFGSGAGRGLRNRGTTGPTVVAAPPSPPSP